MNLIVGAVNVLDVIRNVSNLKVIVTKTEDVCVIMDLKDPIVAMILTNAPMEIISVNTYALTLTERMTVNVIQDTNWMLKMESGANVLDAIRLVLSLRVIVIKMDNASVLPALKVSIADMISMNV